MKKLPKTWAEFCKLTDRDPKALPDVSTFEKQQGKRAIADFKLTLVIAYCNGEEKVDYTNPNQWKYYPIWKVLADKKRPSGFGLSSYYFDCWVTFAAVCPRLCFLDLKVLMHVVKYFIEEYTDLLL